MIPIAMVLFVFSMTLIVLGWRGRIVDRGVFCRGCRFDLAGIDTEAEQARCPECGRDLTQPKASRPILRQKRRAVLVLGILLLLSGCSILGVVASNNTARVFAALPDGVVIGLHDLGVDAAFTEITTNRLFRIKKPLSDETWDGLIRDAIAHQQNTDIAWDPRQGEVLANALIDGRLTNDQVSEYLRLAIETFSEFPDSIRHGADRAGLQVNHSSSRRVSALNQMSTVTYQNEQIIIWMTIKRAGLVDPEYSAEIDSTSGGMFTVPGTYGRSMGGSGARVPLGDLDWSLVEPNTEVMFFVEYQVEVKASFQDEPIAQWTQTDKGMVRILPADAQLVKLNTDPEMINSFRNNPHARVTPLYIPSPEERNTYGSVTMPLEFDFVNSELPVALAGDIYLLNGGLEVRVCGISVSASQGIGIRMLTWTLPADEVVDEALLQSWLEAGTVTLEYRPNPGIAEDTHNIREILDVPLRFSNVPVTDEKSVRQGYSNEPADNETIGRPIEE